MNANTRYNEWLEKLHDGCPLRDELIAIKDDAEEIEDRFYQDLTFGTAGLRGKIGAGTNRMNFRTVGKATQGIADFIKEHGQDAMDRGVVIAHDCRHFSKEFSQMVAGIFAANGIKAYTFPSLRPTPELAYMIRKLNCISGINITASHNPKDYNGYKAYWEDGCQVASDIADGMLRCIENVDIWDGVKKMDFEKGVEEGLITILGPEYDRAYLDLVESLKIHDGDELDHDISIVYTPLNGAGSIPVETVLKERGFTNVHIVEEQRNPDPDFTTVGYPNPENTAAFEYSERLGKKVGAELLIATDPDSDRLAIEVLTPEGEYLAFNGNQTGVFLINYILEGKKEHNELPENGAMVKSIVTGCMSTAICEAYGVKMFETLTGFKNICGKVPYLEANNLQYLFGYEESIGYAACPDIRDKDGVSASMLLAEAAAYYKKKGKTVYEAMEDIYKQYGYYAEDQVNVILEGIPGAARIKRMMSFVRNDLPKEFAGIKVDHVIDYKDGYEDIAPSNVLRFFLEDGTWFAMRPSGTEPKIKFYFYTKKDSREEALETIEVLKKSVLDLVNSVE